MINCTPCAALLFRRLAFLLFLLVLVHKSPVAQTSNLVTESYRTGDFKLVYRRAAADILVSPEDFQVAHIAGRDLAEDIRRVTGIQPRIKTDAASLAPNTIIIGTIGTSSVIDRLVKTGK